MRPRASVQHLKPQRPPTTPPSANSKSTMQAWRRPPAQQRPALIFLTADTTYRSREEMSLASAWRPARRNQKRATVFTSSCVEPMTAQARGNKPHMPLLQTKESQPTPCDDNRTHKRVQAVRQMPPQAMDRAHPSHTAAWGAIQAHTEANMGMRAMIARSHGHCQLPALTSVEYADEPTPTNRIKAKAWARPPSYFVVMVSLAGASGRNISHGWGNPSDQDTRCKVGRSMTTMERVWAHAAP